MYFLRLWKIDNKRMSFIFGKIKKIDNPVMNMYRIHMINGLAFDGENFEQIDLAIADDKNEVMSFNTASRNLIRYLFKE